MGIRKFFIEIAGCVERVCGICCVELLSFHRLFLLYWQNLLTNDGGSYEQA